jgi:probable HAF family extracellular repeat protein
MRNKAILFFLATMLSVPALAQQHYSVIDLGAIGAGRNSTALAVNNRGQVVGWSETRLFSTNHHAYVWDSRNGMRDLGTLRLAPQFPPGDVSEATAINDSGQIAGWSTIFPGDPGAVEANSFIAQGSESVQNIGLPDLGGFSNYAYGINSSARVVGASRIDDPANAWPYHPFLWFRQTGMGDLGAPAGFRQSYAFGVNDRGQSVGYGWDDVYTGAAHAFLWDGKQPAQDLGTFPDGFYSFASAINNGGLIVGSGDTLVTLDFYGTPLTFDAFRAAAWTGPGTITELGALPGGFNSQANAINNHGDIVGSSDTFDPATSVYTTHAFIYRDGVMQDLNNLVDLVPGMEIVSANGISDTGYIVGQVSTLNGFKHHAVLLIPRK